MILRIIGAVSPGEITAVDTGKSTSQSLPFTHTVGQASVGEFPSCTTVKLMLDPSGSISRLAWSAITPQPETWVTSTLKLKLSITSPWVSAVTLTDIIEPFQASSGTEACTVIWTDWLTPIPATESPLEFQLREPSSPIRATL